MGPSLGCLDLFNNVYVVPPKVPCADAFAGCMVEGAFFSFILGICCRKKAHSVILGLLNLAALVVLIIGADARTVR